MCEWQIMPEDTGGYYRCSRGRNHPRRAFGEPMGRVPSGRCEPAALSTTHQDLKTKCRSRALAYVFYRSDPEPPLSRLCRLPHWASRASWPRLPPWPPLPPRGDRGRSRLIALLALGRHDSVALGPAKQLAGLLGEARFLRAPNGCAGDRLG